MADSFQGVSSIASIDTDAVRAALRQTMVMGLPTADASKPTFYWERDVTFANHDNENQPWDWATAPVLETIPGPERVICAYEFFSPLGRQGSFQTEVGEFNPTTLLVTMFETEFATIDGFTYCTIGPSSQRWYFRFYRPSVALNDLVLYQVHCVATGVD